MLSPNLDFRWKTDTNVGKFLARAIPALIGWNPTWPILDAGTAPLARRLGHVVSFPTPHGCLCRDETKIAAELAADSSLYAIAAIFLIIVHDEIGTDNDPQLKAGGWIALTFAVYWSFRGVFAWVVMISRKSP